MTEPGPEGVPIGTEIWSKDVPHPDTYRRWTWEQLFVAYARERPDDLLSEVPQHSH